jgi:hypothetical protein
VSGASRTPPERVPTLTEVVDWPQSGSTPPAPAEGGNAPGTPQVERRITAPMRMPEEQMVQRVLAEVQRQIDLTLEYRLREVLTPLLTRVADNVIREARGELASTLRDVVARAVAQELARHRVGESAR